MVKKINPLTLLGQVTLTACYGLFLLETIELAGFNLLRILFSLIAFTVFSLLLLNLIRSAIVRITGSIILILLLWINLLHFRYFGSTLQLGSLFNIDFLPYLDTQIPYLMRIKDIFFLIAALIIGWTFKTSLVSDRRFARKCAIVLIIFYFSLIIFQYYAITQFPLNRVKRYKEPYTRWDIYSEIRFESRDHPGNILQFGFLWTYLLDLYRLTKNSGPLLEIPEDNYSFHIAEQNLRNIIVLQVETLDKGVLDFKHEGQAITPFLNRLSRENIYFTQIYAQHSSLGGTSDAEFCFLTSQYPPGYKPPFEAIGIEKLPAIPHILEKNGYTTLAFHGNRGSFFNRKQGFIKLGFSQVYFKKEFHITDPDRWHTIKDEDFLNQVADILSTAEEPFFAFILTLTSHTPFDLLDPKDHQIKITDENPLVANYLASINYVDSAIKAFILKVAQLYPDAVILIYGDHSSRLKSKFYQAIDSTGLEPIPVILIDPQMKDSREVTHPGSTLDLGPTLFDHFNFEIPEFWQGQSLLPPQSSQQPILLINSKYYITPGGKVKRISNGNPDLTPLTDIQNYIW